jgi:hypothetical protein
MKSLRTTVARTNGNNSTSREISSNGPAFSSSLETIIFSDYEPFQKYKQIISFRNNDTVSTNRIYSDYI